MWQHPQSLKCKDVLSALQVKALKQPELVDYMLLVLLIASNIQQNKLGYQGELEVSKSSDLYCVYVYKSFSLYVLNHSCHHSLRSR